MAAQNIGNTAAVPVLASAELGTLLERNRKRKRTETTCSSIDNCLHGGIESGYLTCISGDKETGKSTITLHVIANKLLSSEYAEAVVLDTTGTFDVFRLHQIAMLKITENGISDDEKSAKAEQILQRLKIMRVFDFQGALEAVDEVGLDLKSTSVVGPTASRRRMKHGKETMEIPDSEEDELSDESDESIPIPVAASPAVEMLVIDNLATIVTPFLKSSHVQAQSQLISFLRKLSRMTKDFNFISLIVNGIVRHQQKDNAAQETNMAQMQAATGNNVWNTPSIFMANNFRPALGRSFLHVVDLHLLLSVLPKSERDARIKCDRYGEDKVPDLLGIAPKTVNVMEVIMDRYDARVGRWAAFRIERGLELNNTV